MNTVQLSVNLKKFGITANSLIQVRLRQDGIFVPDDAIDLNRTLEKTTKNGIAVFAVYASPDLTQLGFNDAWYIVTIVGANQTLEIWVPSGGGDLKDIIALVPPGGPATPPGAVAPHNHDSRYYLKSQTDALVNEEAGQRLEADQEQSEQIAALQTDVAAAAATAQEALDHVGDSVTHSELDAEHDARIAADAVNAAAITAEAGTRAAADTSNANAITAEAGTRAAAINAINAALAALGIANIAGLSAALGGKADLDESGHLAFDQIPVSLLGALRYQGSWDASANTPHLTSSVGTKGFYYVVSTAGSTSLNGQSDWALGDHAVYNGTIWEKYDYSAIVYTSGNLVANDPTNGNATAMLQSVLANLWSTVSNHVARTDNPHGTTAAQVGLGNVNNTSDANKPISNATQTALNGKAADTAVVHITGAETITGVKTLSSELVLSDLGADPATLTNRLYSLGGLLKWAGKRLALIASALGTSQVVETDASGYLITSAKATAYNKNFGTVAGTVMQGDDARALNYDLALSFYGVPAANATVQFKAVRPFTLPQNLTNSQNAALTAATGSYTISLRKNGVQFATLVIAAAGTVGGFSAASATAFVVGDVLSAVCPATADATLANVSLVLAGVMN